MAHFAEIDNNNIVLRVIIVSNDVEAEGENWCFNLLGGRWKQTSYNTIEGKHKLGGLPIRKNYASPGYTYDEHRDAFIPPKPYNSWVLNEETCVWDPPVPIPNTNDKYYWDENSVSWQITQIQH